MRREQWSDIVRNDAARLSTMFHLAVSQYLTCLYLGQVSNMLLDSMFQHIILCAQQALDVMDHS